MKLAITGRCVRFEAQIVYAVREEMAQKLEDVVFRRTEFTAGEYRDDAVLRRVADIAAKELKWVENRLRNELSEVKEMYPNFCRPSELG